MSSDSEDDQADGPGHGKHYELHDLETSKATEFKLLPGACVGKINRFKNNA